MELTFTNQLTLNDQIETLEAEMFNNEFGWDIAQNPVYRPDGTLIPGYKTIERGDNGAILNMCKSSYTPVTNEMFTEFVYRLSNITGYEIQEFSEFHNGAKVLAFLKAPETSLNGWKYDNYIAVGNAHDSSKAFFVANTQVMIRCTNQFSLAAKGLKVYHTTGLNAQMKQIEESYQVWNHNQKALERNYAKLLSQKANGARAEKFVKHMLEIDPEIKILDENVDLSGRKLNQLADLAEAIEIESNDLGLNDFALFHGVTRWTTHTRKQKDRTFGNLFGSNAQLNQRALQFLLN